MGWNTDIVVIAQGIDYEKDAVNVKQQLFDMDSKTYGEESCYFIEGSESYSIYYHYDRRKYAPFWIVQEISNAYRDIRFTILGSMLEFLGGPSGVIRIVNGEIYDSYGIAPDRASRNAILDEPLSNKEIIFEYFKFDGIENQLRNKYLNDFPLGWCEQQYVEKLIPIDNFELEEMIDSEESLDHGNWREQEKLKM